MGEVRFSNSFFENMKIFVDNYPRGGSIFRYQICEQWTQEMTSERMKFPKALPEFRDGFTVVELLVSISILSILFALLMPAIQSSRESARRTQCSSQMRQIGIAMQAYESTYQHLPLHTHLNSFLVAILAEIEQASLLTHSSVQDRIALQFIEVDTYVCPSDSKIPPNRSQGIPAGTSYLGNIGHSYLQYREFNGIFTGQIPPLKFSDVTDGASNTASVSEAIGPWSWKSIIYHTPVRYVSLSSMDPLIQNCRQAAIRRVAGPRESRVGSTWVDAGSSVVYTHTLYPNDVSCANGDENFEGILSAGSAHPGGVNLLLLDGSVRFVSSSIDLNVWRAIGDRHGGNFVAF